jgi:hypothetical protein
MMIGAKAFSFLLHHVEIIPPPLTRLGALRDEAAGSEVKNSWIFALFYSYFYFLTRSINVNSRSGHYQPCLDATSNTSTELLIKLPYPCSRSNKYETILICFRRVCREYWARADFKVLTFLFHESNNEFVFMLLYVIYLIVSRYSDRLLTGRPGFDSRQCKFYFLLHTVQTDSRAHPASYPIGTVKLSPCLTN